MITAITITAMICALIGFACALIEWGNILEKRRYKELLNDKN